MKKLNVALMAVAFIAALGLSAQTAWATHPPITADGVADVDILDPIGGAGGPLSTPTIEGMHFGRNLPTSSVTVLADADNSIGASSNHIDGGTRGLLDVTGSAQITATPQAGSSVCTNTLGANSVGSVTLSAVSVSPTFLTPPIGTFGTFGVGGTMTASGASATTWSCGVSVTLDY